MLLSCGQEQIALPLGWIDSLGRSKSKKRIREITVLKADPQTKKSSKTAPSVIELRREIADLGLLGSRSQDSGVSRWAVSRWQQAGARE